MSNDMQTVLLKLTLAICKDCSRGPSIKDVRTRGGREGKSKADTCGRRGEGGSVAKCGRPQNSNVYQNFRSFLVYYGLKDNINSITEVSESIVVRYNSN